MVNVYVDDFKLAVRAGDHDRLWAAIRGSSTWMPRTSMGASLGVRTNDTLQRQLKCMICSTSIHCTTHERKGEPARQTKNQSTLRPTRPNALTLDGKLKLLFTSWKGLQILHHRVLGPHGIRQKQDLYGPNAVSREV